MSRTRVHNFSVSLDGFGTGVDLSIDAPFGHAGHRLVEWMKATRFWLELGVVDPGGEVGTEGVDDAFAERHGHGFGAELMGAGKFGPQGGRTIPSGVGGGARTLRSTRRRSC